MDKVLKRFTDILCGTLDNSAQVEAERKAGKQLHPYAKHVTEIFSQRVFNRPEGHDGIYVLEESYYTQPGKDKIDLKPLLFYLSSNGENKVFLQSVKIPDKFSLEEANNANSNFILDYNDLSISAFGMAEYTLMETNQFTTNHISIIAPGMTFQLIETLSDGHLSVMEIVSKDGVKLTPYDTPIDYIKIS